MKINIEIQNSISETEVTIVCREKSKEIQSFYEYIRQYAKALWVVREGRQYKLMSNHIYYVETVDKKSFYYTCNECWESRETLSEIEEKLKNCSFVRISKSCLMNISYLQSVVPFENHRLLATMENGEKIIVGRAYIQQLKKILKEGWIK